MAEERKVTIEREYVVPLRREWLKVPKYRRAKKAVRALKEFIAKHMKIYDKDLTKVKVDMYLNNELKFRGVRKPWNKIRVKAIKYDDGTVAVKLVELPKHIEFEIARNARRQLESLKNASEEPKIEAKEEKVEQTEDTKEKEHASKEAMEAMEKSKAKAEKHTSKTSGDAPKEQRKSLKK
jgi:large subunit ribosomal protein L31e